MYVYQEPVFVCSNATILDVQLQNGCLLKRSFAMIIPLHAEFHLSTVNLLYLQDLYYASYASKH